MSFRSLSLPAVITDQPIRDNVRAGSGRDIGVSARMLRASSGTGPRLLHLQEGSKVYVMKYTIMTERCTDNWSFVSIGDL